MYLRVNIDNTFINFLIGIFGEQKMAYFLELSIFLVDVGFIFDTLEGWNALISTFLA